MTLNSCLKKHDLIISAFRWVVCRVVCRVVGWLIVVSFLLVVGVVTVLFPVLVVVRLFFWFFVVSVIDVWFAVMRGDSDVR